MYQGHILTRSFVDFMKRFLLHVYIEYVCMTKTEKRAITHINLRVQMSTKEQLTKKGTPLHIMNIWRRKNILRIEVKTCALLSKITQISINTAFQRPQ